MARYWGRTSVDPHPGYREPDDMGDILKYISAMKTMMGDKKYDVSLDDGTVVKMTAAQKATYELNRSAGIRAQETLEEKLVKHKVNIGGEEIELDPAQYATYMLQKDRDKLSEPRYNVNIEGQDVSLSGGQIVSYEQNKLARKALSVSEKTRKEQERVKGIMNAINRQTTNYMAEPTFVEDFKRSKAPLPGEPQPFSFQKAPLSWLLPKSAESKFEQMLPSQKAIYKDPKMETAIDNQISKISNMITGAKGKIDSANLGTEYNQVALAYQQSGLFDELLKDATELESETSYMKGLYGGDQAVLSPMYESTGIMKKFDAAKIGALNKKLKRLEDIKRMIALEQERIRLANAQEGGQQLQDLLNK